MTSRIRFMLLPTLAFLLSCAVEVGPPHEEMAPDYKTSGDPALYTPRPPISKNVAVVPPPAPAATTGGVWVGGYWARGGWGWTWVPGRWVPLPRPGSVRTVDRVCRPWGMN